MQRFRHGAVGMVVLVAMSAACRASGPSEDVNCESYSNAHASHAPGTLTLEGSFLASESVLLKYTENGMNKQKSLTPATDRNQVTFVGLPSGALEYDLVISCQAGQEDLGSQVYEIG
ncbi:MAG: hypothetical protein ABI542_10500 [Gemmatimonadota bacterium]